MHYNLITSIKNSEQAGKPYLLAPFSKVDFAIAKSLVGADYLGSVQKKKIGDKDFMEIKLLKKGDRNIISGFKIISKPSRHIYVDFRNIFPVKQGYGVGIISTSKGIMSDKEARKNKIGGEYLFQVW